MDHSIRASWDELYDQSKSTAAGYLNAAVDKLEAMKLKYTAADAVALASIMQHDFHTVSMVVASQNIGTAVYALQDSIGHIEDVLHDMKEDAK